MILFLMGKQRSGKDTVADYLVQHYKFTKMALADNVKQLAKDYFGMREKDRGLLIKVGMKMREIDPDVWIKRLWDQYTWRKRYYHSNYWRYPSRLVIPDVRLPNEFDFFSDNGGVAVDVQSPLTLRSSRPGYDAEFENDPTEEALKEYGTTLILHNSGTLAFLYSQVDKMMEDIGVTRS